MVLESSGRSYFFLPWSHLCINGNCGRSESDRARPEELSTRVDPHPFPLHRHGPLLPQTAPADEDDDDGGDAGGDADHPRQPGRVQPCPVRSDGGRERPAPGRQQGPHPAAEAPEPGESVYGAGRAWPLRVWTQLETRGDAAQPLRTLHGGPGLRRAHRRAGFSACRQFFQRARDSLPVHPLPAPLPLRGRARAGAGDFGRRWGLSISSSSSSSSATAAALPPSVWAGPGGGAEGGGEDAVRGDLRGRVAQQYPVPHVSHGTLLRACRYVTSYCSVVTRWSCRVQRCR